MIAAIGIKNFKSYHEAELKLSSLTVLIGANASGKSNAIEAIRLLKWLSQGEPLSLLSERIVGSGRGIRGKVIDLYPHASFAEKTTIQLSFQLDNVEYSVTLGTFLRKAGNALMILGEKYVDRLDPEEKSFLIQNKLPEDSHLNQLKFSGKIPLGIGFNPSNDRLGLVQLKELLLGIESDSTLTKEYGATLDRLLRQLNRVQVLNPQPESMRGYSYKVDAQLMEDGTHLSSVLYKLCQAPEMKQRVLEMISSLPEQKFVDIQFIETERDEVLVKLTEAFGQSKIDIDAGLLSSGTLRVLAIVAALLSTAEGSLLIIEDVDDGVHAARMRDLVENFLRIGKERNLQLLVTTHNPALLDALDPEQVEDTIVCYRNENTGFSELVRIEDMSDYPLLIGQGAFGDLLSRGKIEQFAKDPNRVQERKKLLSDWLSSTK